MNFYKISINDAKSLFTKIGCDEIGVKILEKKANINYIYIKNMHVGAANILKQDALSIGADLVVPSGVIIAKDKYVDGILIANNKQIQTLSKKESIQPFGLKNLAKEINSFTKSKNKQTKIMGVLNANDDSFFENSRFDSNNAQTRIENLIEDGADIIDIGGVSSRPGSLPVSVDEELSRVKSIIDCIYENKLYEKVKFSLDSFEPKVLSYALDRGFNIINDITGLQNDEVAKLGGKYNASVVIMHMQNNQTTMQENPVYEDIMIDLDNFFEQRITKAKNYGVQDIILDVGIGFGKNLEHNLSLLKNHEHFLHFGYELLIGASRKSMIDKITPCEIKDRLPGTLSIHLQALQRGASIVRCHDVKEHFQAIKVFEAIENHEIL